jgi:small conductance mechanosensitive channel
MIQGIRTLLQRRGIAAESAAADTAVLDSAAAESAAADAASSGWSDFFRWDEQLFIFLPNLLRAIAVAGLCFATYRLVKLLTRRFLERDIPEEDPIVKRNREQRARTLASLLNNITAVIISVVGLLTVMTVLGFKIAPILGTVGIAGLAISFGAQSLVKDVINGIFILIEGHFGIGDVIRVGETAGQVERMTLRATVLRDAEGIVHILPNGEITRVSNLTKAWSRSMLDLRIAYKEDIDRVMAVLRSLGEEIAADPQWGHLLIDKPEILGVQNFTDSAVIIRMITKTLPLKQWEVGRELRRRIKNRFDQEKIEIPYPHVRVYWGQGQTNTEPSPDSYAASGLNPAEPSDAVPALGSNQLGD